MKTQRSIDGRWWIFGPDKPPHFGTLLFDPETKLELTVKIPQTRTGIEFIQALGEDVDDFPKVVHGENEHGSPITLFGCFWSKSLSSGLDTYTIRSLASLLDYKANSWSDAQFPVARVKYSALGHWFNRRIFQSQKPEANPWCVSFNQGEHLDFKVSNNLSIKIEAVPFPQASIDKYVMRLDYRVWFFFNRPLRIAEIREGHTSTFLRLLYLLTGEKVFIEQLTFFDSNPFIPDSQAEQIELLCTNVGVSKSRYESHASEMVASFEDVAKDFEKILQRWFECDERFGPVLDLYFAIVSGRAKTMQNRFLFSAQALEVYHARSAQFCSTELPAQDHKARVKSIVQAAPAEYQSWLQDKLPWLNQKTLAQRLTEIFQLHHLEVASLTAGISDFPSKVRHTRNYYTHYSREIRQLGKVAEGDELIRITFAMEELLKICLLKEIGINGAPIERIIKRSIPVRIVSLES